MGIDGTTPLELKVNTVVSPENPERRIIGQGMPKAEGRGDLVFRFVIQFPDALTFNQKRLIREAFPDPSDLTNYERPVRRDD
jgi:DnaJ-class molecular chaperone